MIVQREELEKEFTLLPSKAERIQKLQNSTRRRRTLCGDHPDGEERICRSHRDGESMEGQAWIMSFLGVRWRRWCENHPVLY